MKTSQIIILLSFPMHSIDLETLLVTVFVIVDDWSQKAVPPRNHLPGVKPKLSESEILTLALIMDYLPFPGETQFLGFIKANYGSWFPNLLDQSRRLHLPKRKVPAATVGQEMLKNADYPSQEGADPFKIESKEKIIFPTDHNFK